MLIEREKINEAKQKLGDATADIIAELLNVQQWDERNKKGLCPFHEENTPSFIYNPKNQTFKCFGCGKSVDVLDAYMQSGKTYIEAVQKLFEETNVKYSFGEHHVKTQAAYKYPKEVVCASKEKIYEYLAKRGISKATADYLDLREENGNIVFNYYDTSDVLTMVKYRPARKINKGEAKNWCQKDADTMPLLFNMNRINASQPLAIFSGELDCAAAIEAGYQNSVSIPLGDQNTHWVETCWDFLEQFESIIICPDNDESGMKYCKEIVPRLGSWRCRVVDVPADCKDANEVLYRHGKEELMRIILEAKDTPIECVSDFSDIQNVDIDEIDGVKTGIKNLDDRLMKLFFGTFNIVTGVNGCVSCDTEFFNGSEWKPISEYQEGELVMQYTKDGFGELVQPRKFHKYKCDKMWHIYSPYGIDQVVSEEHNIVILGADGKPHKLSMKDALAFGKEFYATFITTFNYYKVFNDEWVIDGLRKRCSGRTLFTKDKKEADFAQFTYASNGYRSEINTSVNEDGETVYEVTRSRMNRPMCDLRTKTDSITECASPDGYKYCFTVPSGMLVLRHNGRINITGNSGKSSFLSSIVCNALDEGKNVFLYSGELPNFQTKNWINYIFAGQRNVNEYQYDGAPLYKVPLDVQQEINDYYRGKLFIYKDGYSHKATDLLKAMESTCRKYGCKLFVIDNLTSVNLECNEQNKYQKQEEFTTELISFAKKYNVTVIEVIHPHKIETMRRLTKMDVQGVSALIDLAHRIISLYRVTNEDKRGIPKQKGDGWVKEPIKFDVLCDVLKDRMLGYEGSTVGLYYDRPSRRFFENEKDLDRKYNWDKKDYKGDLPYPPPQLHDEAEAEVFG